MFNSTNYNATNLYGNLAPIIAPTVADSPVPYYNSQVGDAVLHHFAKSMNYYSYNNPPLKDDSGLTFNNNALPLPRKRPRESSPPPPLNKEGTVSFLSDELSLQMMQQQFEVDRLLSFHMEKVRSEMEERRRKQASRVIQTIEEAVARKLKEKEDEIERMGRLNWAMEERIKSMCVENQIWRDLAETNEANAKALRSNLEQVISQANKNERISSDDAESCCGSTGEGCDDDDGRRVLRWRKVGERKERMCRKCGERESSVLLLPCRHLCICSECGPAVETCPICNSTKNASVHVNLC